MVRIYGIRNCDTMKKALAWLEANGIAHEFHDYKKSGISAQTLAGWEKALGWETLLNRRGTTWRTLDATTRDTIDRAAALRLMQEQTSLIRRPVLAADGVLLCGFDADAWRKALTP